MNAQQLFDTVVNHLRAQGKKAMDDFSSVCLYRAPDGSKCAAGILIPDEVYTPDMEGRGLVHLIDDYRRTELSDLFGTNLPLVVNLQYIHDSKPISSWELSFQTTAVDFGLNYTAPEQP